MPVRVHCCVSDDKAVYLLNVNFHVQIALLTLDELPLALDDLVAERPLLVVLEDEEVPPLHLVLFEHGLALHLHLLDLQLVHLAQQRQDLALLVCADPPGQLLQKEESNGVLRNNA